MFSIAIIAISFASLSMCASDKVHVDVYYESLCRDSKNFFLKQLKPTYSEMSTVMEVELIPFGKASATRGGHTGWEFTCHHGPVECYGNKIQSCLVTNFHDIPMSTKIDFIACMFNSFETPKTADLDRGAQDCSRTYNIDWGGLLACANSTDGSNILVTMGNKTEAVMPVGYKFSVPWIIVNGHQHDRDDQMRAESNFMQLVCDKYGGEKPHVCTSSAMTSIIISAPVTLFALSITLLRF